jgi:hypothetical protein
LNFSILSFDAVEYKRILKDLPSIDNNAMSCQVELTLNYTGYYLEVIFDSIPLTDNSILIGEPKLITTFALDSYLSSIVSVLIYNCFGEDACDRDFVLDYSYWLLNLDYVIVQRKFTELLLRKKKISNKMHYTIIKKQITTMSRSSMYC